MICYMSSDIQQFLNTRYGVLNAISDFVGHAEPSRKTKNYAENNWGRILYGHPVFDAVYNRLCVTK